MDRPTWRNENSLSPRSASGGNLSSGNTPGSTWRAGGSANPSETFRDGTTANSSGQQPTTILRLPSSLAGHWWIVRELASRGAEADLLVVRNASGERRVAKIYRAGIESKGDVLRRLGGTSFEHVVRMFDHGRSD